MTLPVLSPCERPGCHHLTHLRYCIEHADDDQREAQDQLDELRVKEALALDALTETRARRPELERRLGIRRA